MELYFWIMATIAAGEAIVIFFLLFWKKMRKGKKASLKGYTVGIRFIPLDNEEGFRGIAVHFEEMVKNRITKRGGEHVSIQSKEMNNEKLLGEIQNPRRFLILGMIEKKDCQFLVRYRYVGENGFVERDDFETNWDASALTALSEWAERIVDNLAKHIRYEHAENRNIKIRSIAAL